MHQIHVDPLASPLISRRSSHLHFIFSHLGVAGIQSNLEVKTHTVHQEHLGFSILTNNASNH